MEISTISVRINTEDKLKFESFCNNTGLNVSTAINMYIKAVLINNSIPFIIKNDIPISYDKPNALTAEAITEGDKLIAASNQEEYKDSKTMRKALGL